MSRPPMPRHVGVEVALHLLVPAPDGRYVGTHGGFVQMEAEFAVRGGGRPQANGRHAARSMARAAVRKPAPRVTLVRSRTVEKVDSMGFVARRWIQCSAGKS